MTRSLDRSAIRRVGIIFRRISDASDWSSSRKWNRKGEGLFFGIITRAIVLLKMRSEENLSVYSFLFSEYTRGKINSTI